MGSRRGSDTRPTPLPKAAPAKLGVFLSGLIEAGLIEPPLALERRYRDHRLQARIAPSGDVTCMGRTFCTLSSAASYARSTCTGGPVEPDARQLSCNGWTFWQFRNEEGELESIGNLRSRFLKG